MLSECFHPRATAEQLNRRRSRMDFPDDNDLLVLETTLNG